MCGYKQNLDKSILKEHLKQQPTFLSSSQACSEFRASFHHCCVVAVVFFSFFSFLLLQCAMCGASKNMEERSSESKRNETTTEHTDKYIKKPGTRKRNIYNKPK